MENKQHSPFYKVLSGLFLLWALIATGYILLPQLVTTGNPFAISPNASAKKVAIDQGFIFLKDFLKDYYTLNSMQEKNQILEKFKSYFHPQLQDQIIPEYKDALKHFTSNGGSQSVQFVKVMWTSTDQSYIFFLKVKQKIQGSKSHQYWIKLRVVLLAKKNLWTISSWQERVLPTRPQTMTDKNINLNLRSPSLIHFPCKIKEISTEKTQTPLEIKKSAHSRELSILIKKGNFVRDSLKVSCEKMNFHLVLNSRKDVMTLYQDFGLKDGTLKKMKLSPEQKLKKDIEEQLGITIIN